MAEVVVVIGGDARVVAVEVADIIVEQPTNRAFSSHSAIRLTLNLNAFRFIRKYTYQIQVKIEINR